MAKCVYCGRRKGKRSCPALRGEICTSCCGEHRGKAIRCPTDCVYFAPHEDYQRERTGAVFEESWRSFLQEVHRRWGEKGNQFIFFLTLILFRQFAEQADARDGDALAGLALLRKHLSPIQSPQTMTTPVGDLLIKESEVFLKEVLLPSSDCADLMDGYIRFLTDFSGGEVASNRALRGLVGFIQKHFPEAAQAARKGERSTGRIITP